MGLIHSLFLNLVLRLFLASTSPDNLIAFFWQYIFYCDINYQLHTLQPKCALGVKHTGFYRGNHVILLYLKIYNNQYNLN